MLPACSPGYTAFASSGTVPFQLQRYAGTTTVSLITAKNDSDSCLQGCYQGDCGAGTDNYVALAACDERLSQLWLISTVSRNLVNVASGFCLSVTSDNVVVMAGCGNSSPAQTWMLYANDTLEPQSNAGSFLSVCDTGTAGCNAKIMGLFSNDGQLITIANTTSEAAASGSWQQSTPSKSFLLADSAQKDKTIGQVMTGDSIAGPALSLSDASASSDQRTLYL